jgi:pyruvate ferredoxin oxidoreductase alpha subunit/phenylglyoxylate dehydrogenase alpha subunit
MEKTIVCDGNEAAAWGACLAKPDMVAVYPITPQSSLGEHLSEFITDGKLAADLMDVEGEHTVLSVLQGACLAGGRTFTATCGQGLAFMFEPYFRSPNLRLPIVMAIVCRDGITPQTVWGGQQDAMSVKEAGWIQMHAETNQEILDTIIMSYRIAEHPEVLLPVNVCLDGNYLSYGFEVVKIPDSQLVDEFLGKKDVNWHVALDPDRPMAVDPLTGGTGKGAAMFVRYRKGQCKGMQRALKVITEVHAEYAKKIGRSFAPLIEEYRMEDAEYAIMTIGSMTGAGREAVDIAREEGKKVGLLKVKTFQPFPIEALNKSVAKIKALGVVDRSVNYGWGTGHLYKEVAAAMYFGEKRIPAISLIGGLSGADITVEKHFRRVIEITERAAQGDVETSVVWLNENDDRDVF